MRIKITEKGERIIMDPAVIISRVYLYFYLMINVGSWTGRLGWCMPKNMLASGFRISCLL